MPADSPTILATSGGIGPGRRTRLAFTPLTDYAVELSGISGRAPRMCLLATAMGDDSTVLHYLTEAARQRGFAVSCLSLFPMPNVDDPAGHLMDQDVIWVFGGSVAGLLAMWRLHGLDTAVYAAWQAGVVLTGVSAGSLCWHVGGTTDSFGPRLQPVTDGLGFVPYANGVHYDSEEQRRPLLHSLIQEHVLPAAYATDDGAGVLYRGTTFVERSPKKPERQPITWMHKMAWCSNPDLTCEDFRCVRGYRALCRSAIEQIVTNSPTAPANVESPVTSASA